MLQNLFVSIFHKKWAILFKKQGFQLNFIVYELQPHFFFCKIKVQKEGCRKYFYIITIPSRNKYSNDEKKKKLQIPAQRKGKKNCW